MHLALVHQGLSLCLQVQVGHLTQLHVSITDISSHHFKNHSRPFQCGSCPARHATKRQRDRHVNEKHNRSESYFCTVATCKRSLTDGSNPFPRMENCRRHMMLAHKFTSEQVIACDMDDETRSVREERKVGRQIVTSSAPIFA